MHITRPPYLTSCHYNSPKTLLQGHPDLDTRQASPELAEDGFRYAGHQCRQGWEITQSPRSTSAHVHAKCCLPARGPEVIACGRYRPPRCE